MDRQAKLIVNRDASAQLNRQFQLMVGLDVAMRQIEKSALRMIENSGCDDGCLSRQTSEPIDKCCDASWRRHFGSGSREEQRNAQRLAPFDSAMLLGTERGVLERSDPACRRRLAFARRMHASISSVVEKKSMPWPVAEGEKEGWRKRGGSPGRGHGRRRRWKGWPLGGRRGGRGANWDKLRHLRPSVGGGSATSNPPLHHTNTTQPTASDRST